MHISLSDETQTVVLPVHHLAVRRRTVHSTCQFQTSVFQCRPPTESQLMDGLCSATFRNPTRPHTDKRTSTVLSAVTGIPLTVCPSVIFCYNFNKNRPMMMWFLPYGSPKTLVFGDVKKLWNWKFEGYHSQRNNFLHYRYPHSGNRKARKAI